MAGVTCRLPSVFSQFIRNSQIISTSKHAKHLIAPASTTHIPHRNSSFRSSNPVADISEYPEVEVIKNPPEWKFVERLLPSPTVPKPVAKKEYPSGWKPPQPINTKCDYFVARSRNFMVPVYLHTKYRGLRRITVVRYIQGNIWNLERELHKLVEDSKGGKLVASRVNELSGQIHFHGDYVKIITDFLVAKGF
ncbi:probable 39S ribosomal protein L49, mitochondrial [Episyrphus balteatus]|uniref:probable 39S ribosomal protein L49, mitochondrial n=1 Tax=Episyrphus balteatus TaxID=286459 RepID=UPI0024865CAE|nr:probable 39S ribosomal protein L49, mitochondrial [Episyrphus balteatus]